MKLHELNHRTEDNDTKLTEVCTQFMNLIIELEKRELPDSIAVSINNDIDEINSSSFVGNELRKTIKQKLQRIIKQLEKELKVVPKNYYRNLWMILGMSAFGIPLGVAFGTSLGSMAYLGIGLPIGLAIGLAVGDGMDKKALKEGRQLDFDFKY